MLSPLSRRPFHVAGTVVFAALYVLLISGRAPLTESLADPGPETTPDQAIPAKSIAFYVGRNLTEDGSVLLGGFGHEPSSHWYEITPARTFPPGTTMEVGITEEARIPGRRFRIPQVRETFRFITTNYSEFAGFPRPLTNGGLNERQVAARDVWSPSRQELRDPALPRHGRPDDLQQHLLRWDRARARRRRRSRALLRETQRGLRYARLDNRPGSTGIRWRTRPMWWTGPG